MQYDTFTVRISEEDDIHVSANGNVFVYIDNIPGLFDDLSRVNVERNLKDDFSFYHIYHEAYEMCNLFFGPLVHTKLFKLLLELGKWK